MNDLISNLRGFPQSEQKAVLAPHEADRPKSFDEESDSVAAEESKEEDSSASKYSILSQPPKAGERTEKDGLKRKRARPNFFSPDQRPDIVIFRESNQDQLALDESLTHENSVHPIPSNHGRAQKQQLAHLEEEEKQKAGSRPKRSRTATNFWIPDTRPDIAIPKRANLSGKKRWALRNNGVQHQKGSICEEERGFKPTSGSMKETDKKDFMFVLSHDDNSSRSERATKKRWDPSMHTHNPRNKDRNGGNHGNESIFPDSSNDVATTKRLVGLHESDRIARKSDAGQGKKEEDFTEQLTSSKELTMPSRCARSQERLHKRNGQTPRTAVFPDGLCTDSESAYTRKIIISARAALSNRKSCRESDPRKSRSTGRSTGTVNHRTSKRATRAAPTRLVQIHQVEEDSEVEWIDRTEDDAVIASESETASLGSPRDLILASLAKRQKHPKHENSRNTVREGSANITPKILSEQLDDKSGVAYIAALAILQKIDSKTSLKFCQRCLQDYSGQAKRVLQEFREYETLAKRRKLRVLRNTIVGLWCAYARVLLSVADMVPVDPRSDVKRKHPFDHVDQMHLPRLRKSLIDAALMVLGQAACCPLAGNHAWIGLSYSKIAQAAFGNNTRKSTDSDDDESSMGHRSLRAAGTLCQPARGQPGDARSYFDQRLIDRLIQVGIVDESTTAALLEQRTGNILLGAPYILADDSSESILMDELRLLDTVQNPGNSSTKLKFSTDRGLASLLSQLPLPSNETGAKDQLQGSGRQHTNSSNIRAGEIVSVGSSHWMEESEGSDAEEVITWNSMCCFGIEMIKNDISSDTRSSRMWGVTQYENEHVIAKSFHVKENRKEKSLEGSQDVTFYCPGCGSGAEFISREALHEHLKKCTSELQPVASVAQGQLRRRFRFGSSRLIGDWTQHSIDPEKGPLLSPDELLNVLDYSVELFDVQKKHLVEFGREKRLYSLSEPCVPGQFGLRCRHCKDNWDDFGQAGSFVFPKSIEKFSQAFWYLSLTHLDNCENQPRLVRNWHEEYRKHVRLNSFLPAEYWKTVAAELKLVSTKTGGVVSA